MVKIAFVFPGQGSQYVGMGKGFYDRYGSVRKIYQQADEALGFKLSQLCFEGPEEALRQTENTQPAILTASIACLAVLREHGIDAEMVAGHSLGEYGALVAAGAITFTDAVQLVRKRGRFMEEAVPNGKGTMAAILGLDKERVLEACAQARKFGLVEAVNFNCPGQIVISGETQAVAQAVELCKAEGAKRVVALAVSGPFHTSLLSSASEKLARELSRVEVKDPAIPVVANYTGDFVKTAEEVKNALINQVSHPVLWEDCVHKMVTAGVNVFVEVGPGKVLTGFTKKIAKEASTLNIEDDDSLRKVLAFFGEVS